MCNIKIFRIDFDFDLICFIHIIRVFLFSVLSPFCNPELKTNVQKNGIIRRITGCRVKLELVLELLDTYPLGR